ncbi:hypothetical protein Ancab_025254 [Ancistrocladus abbreviatus]
MALDKVSSREVVNSVKRSTVVTEVIARERTLVYHVVQEERDVIRHFSHFHALQEYKCQARHCIKCDAYWLDILGAAYGCAKCDFYLHKSFFEAPRELKHGAYPKHALKLLSKAPYSSGDFWCNGCAIYSLEEEDSSEDDEDGKRLANMRTTARQLEYYSSETTSSLEELGRSVGGLIGGVTGGLIGVIDGVIGGLTGGLTGGLVGGLNRGCQRL